MTKCSGMVSNGWHSYQCSKSGKLEHEGKLFCGLHHPPTIWKKRAEKERQWNEEYEIKRKAVNEAKALKAQTERRAALFPELLAALIDLDKRLRECEGPIYALEAYDSFYQENVADVIVKATKE